MNAEPELSDETIKRLRKIATENPFTFNEIKAAYDIVPNFQAIENACRYVTASGRFGWGPADVLMMIKKTSKFLKSHA